MSAWRELAWDLNPAEAPALGVLALLILTLGVGVWGGVTLSRLRRSWRTRSRVNNALVQERQALKLLEAAGYRVMQQQAVQRWEVRANDETLHIRLRADFLVERSGCVYVADAKFGDLAGDVRTAATRRQLLEYLLAYRADGALLLDMARERIVRVEFPDLA